MNTWPMHPVKQTSRARWRRGPAAARGFTLIEIMVVVVILGILAAAVVPSVFSRVDQARVTTAKQDLKQFETALNLYRVDNFRLPTNDQGLKALVSKPSDAKNYPPGGYLGGNLKKDPWGNDYRYAVPGTHGLQFDVFTYGADGQEGGEGNDADIGNWNAD